MVADCVATMHGEIDGPAKLLRPLPSSSRSLDGRIKADDDVGSWEKGLILARSILTAVKEERVRKFPFQGIVSRGIRGNSSVFFWLSRGRNKSNYRRNVSSEFEDRVNIQNSIKSLFCRMEKKV